MKHQNELKTGIFIFVSLFLFAFSIFIMGKERQIFAKQEEYFASFRDIKGLNPGAPVRLGGITIGRVDKVRFAEHISDPNIHVTLLINEEFLERIRLDSIITIETQGLLGDRFINISTGKNKTQLPPGSFVTTQEVGDFSQILTKAQMVVDNTVEFSQNFNKVMAKFESETLDNLNNASKSIANLSKEIETGDGFLHRLVYSKKDGESIIKDLSDTADNVSKISHEISDGDGLLHALIFEPVGKNTISSLMEATQGLSESASHMSQLAAEVKNGQGLLHNIIYNKSEGDLGKIVTELNQTAENLRKASEALSQGSGTLGALLVDSQLYDNLVEVTDGAKRSFLLRQAIRSSLEK